MKNALRNTGCYRLTALLLCLGLVFGLAAAQAQMQDPVTISLSWTAPDGSPKQQQAMAVSYPDYPNSYWLYVEQEALQQGAVLTVSDNLGQYPGGFSIPAGQPLQELLYQDAGSSLLQGALPVVAFGAQGEQLMTFQLYISTQAQMPDPPEAPVTEAPISDAPVKVYYRDHEGREIAPMQEKSYAAGTHDVYAEPGPLGPEYTPTFQGPQQVYVDANGANPSELTFIYQYTPPVTEAPIQDAPVKVFYRDHEGREIAPMQERSYAAGTHDVYAEPGPLGPEYTPTFQGPQQVHVDANGANPSELTFIYQYTPPVTEAPIQDAPVKVFYRDHEGREIAPMQERSYAAGTHDVYAEPGPLGPEYTPNFQGPQQVHVDANGANPSELTFIYQYTPPVTEAPIPDAPVKVYYRDHEGREIAPMQEKSYSAGTHDVYAEPGPLGPEYTPNFQGPQQVHVDANGANPSELTFIYQYTPPVTEAPTPEPVQPAEVSFRFVNQEQEPIAPDQHERYPEGEHSYTAPQELSDGYLLQGEATVSFRVDAQGAHPAEFSFVYAKPEAKPVRVQVLYLDEDGKQVAEGFEREFQQGTYRIDAPPIQPPDYSLIGSTSQDVTVGADSASPNPVIFYYRKPAVAPPVDVPVRFEDEQGKPVASAKSFTLMDGTNTVEAQPDDLKPSYELVGDKVQYIVYSTTQPAPEAIRFVYREVQEAPQPTPTPEEATPAPAPKAAVVPVLYQDQFGKELYAERISVREGEPVTVSVNLGALPEQNRYTLNDEAQKSVAVGSDGLAVPEKLVFLFTDTKPPVAVEIAVHYRLEDGTPVADSSSQMLTKLGLNEVPPAPPAPIIGYNLLSQSPQMVNVDNAGKAQPEEVVFLYSPVPTPTPSAPTEMPYVINALQNTYAYPYSDSVNFRSAPRMEENYVTDVLTKESLVHILGEMTNERDEPWYYAEVNGKKGFLRQHWVTLLTPEQVNEMLGITPAPTATPTPSPTEIPEGMPIDLWGEINTNKVNFRSKPDSKDSKTYLRQLNKGQKVWVYSQEMVGTELWYSVMDKGTKGFIVAKFVDLMSKEESDAYQASLATPMPLQTMAPTQTPVVTESPAPTETAAPEATATQAPAATNTAAPPSPTPTPATYKGYALTIQQVSLRSGANTSDEAILAVLPINSLVYLWGQTYVGGVTWNHVDAIQQAQSGYLPDSALRRIDKQEADIYLAQLRPQLTPTPTAQPTQLPAKVTGYAITLGDNVPLRSHYNSKAQILLPLPERAVVFVVGQEYDNGETWHLSQFGSQYGFIRADQLRLFTPQETTDYLNSLNRPTPTPVGTPPPYNQNTLSSYGYINGDVVRLRSEASSSSTQLKIMNKNAFALVISSVQANDGTWYRINQGGTEGYVHSKYLTVLPLDKLSTYLASPEYQNANNVPKPPAGGTGGGNLTSVEDFNAGVWLNPAQPHATFEPFNPSATATPWVETIQSPVPVTGEETGFQVEATASVDPYATFEPLGTEPPQKKGSSFPAGLLAVGIIGVLGGGGFYAYRMYRENQRRAAQRAAQRRQQAQQPGVRPSQPQTGGQPPYARSAEPQGGQPSPYQPPRPAQPGQPPQAGTAPYRPVQPGQQPPQAGTTTYRPVQPGQQPPRPVQPGQQPPQAGTTAYRPVQPAQQPPRPAQPGQQPPQAGTTAYRPVQPAQQPPRPVQPGQQPPQAGTTAYRPVQPAQQPPRPAQPGQQPPQAGTTTYRPVQPAQQPPQQQAAPPQQAQQPPQDSQGAPRRRRSDRNS